MRRVRTVEYDPGWGWIARDPRTGEEIEKDFRWRTRSVARDVVRQIKHSAQGASTPAHPTEGENL